MSLVVLLLLLFIFPHLTFHLLFRHGSLHRARREASRGHRAMLRVQLARLRVRRRHADCRALADTRSGIHNILKIY